MQHLEVSCAVRRFFKSLGFKGLTIQHAKRMHRIVLSSVACPALHNFTSLSYKGYDFRKNLTEQKMCFDFLNKLRLKRFSF